jgi:2-polyprenyl-6-methoxyphenol hydroxylase-like FAD-dependent oxidoreductase
MARAVVVGAGVSGLGAALVLARRGDQVTVLERDDTPMPATADEAFEWDRRGAPQVRHSHAFLARLVTLLRDHHPDVLAALVANGATPLRFGDDLPPTLNGFVPEPGDDDLVMLACRRTTFEWVLRRVVLDTNGVEIRTGVAVTGLTATPAGADPPQITGAVLDDGSTVEADLVVVASGRRSALPDWLAALGVGPVGEEVDDTGIVYLSRFYRLRQGAEAPPRAGLIGGDLGYLKYGVFIGDARTFSITLAVPLGDDELRRRLADPATFEAAGRELVATAPWLDGRAVPITEQVHVMAGLLNRWREYTADGRPLALGLFPVGDALMCTNPLYGRGCSTGFWSAHLLGQALDAHTDDPPAQARAYDAAVRAELRPWYRATVVQDAEARRVAAALLAGEDPDGDSSDPRTFMRGVFRDGLVPALRLDAVVLRAFLRNFNLLTPPNALIDDQEVNARVLAVWNDREHREPEAPLGPSTRKELLDAIG